MGEYKLYVLDDAGHIMAPPRIIDAADDAAAVQTARQYLDGKDLELWLGARRVATLKPD